MVEKTGEAFVYAEDDPVNDTDPSGDTPTPSGCSLPNVGNPHLAKSLNYGAVKVNVTVRCPVAV
jgi:hypothetical protein